MTDTRGRFVYTDEDKVEIITTTGNAREDVRRVLGAAGYALSDEQIDAIIAAAQLQA